LKPPLIEPELTQLSPIRQGKGSVREHAARPPNLRAEGIGSEGSGSCETTSGPVSRNSRSQASALLPGFGELLLQRLDFPANHDVDRTGTGGRFRVGAGEPLHSLGERVELGGKRDERGCLGPSPYFSPCLRHPSSVNRIDNPKGCHQMQVGSGGRSLGVPAWGVRPPVQPSYWPW